LAPRLIALAAKKRAGKDTFASLLQKYHPYEKLAFADSVWEFMLAFDPYVDLQKGWRLTQVVRFHTRDEAKMLYPEIRRLLQMVGTDAVRHMIDNNTWVDMMEAKIRNSPNPVVISDLRFPNEADLVKRLGGLVVKIERAATDESYGSDHVSESYIDVIKEDLLIYNNSDLNDLELAARELVRR
jgi:hypothetical protein